MGVPAQLNPNQGCRIMRSRSDLPEHCKPRSRLPVLGLGESPCRDVRRCQEVPCRAEGEECRGPLGMGVRSRDVGGAQASLGPPSAQACPGKATKPIDGDVSDSTLGGEDGPGAPIGVAVGKVDPHKQSVRSEGNKSSRCPSSLGAHTRDWR